MTGSQPVTDGVKMSQDKILPPIIMRSLNGFEANYGRSLSGVKTLSDGTISISNGQITGVTSLQTGQIDISGNITQYTGTCTLKSVTSTSLNVTGNITNTGFQQAQTDISTLQSKTQNQSATSGNTTITGSLNVTGNITNTGFQSLQRDASNLVVLTSNLSKTSDNVTTLTGSLFTSKVTLTVPTFTDYTSGTFTVSASSEYQSPAQYQAWRPLSTVSGWISNGFYNTSGAYTGTTTTTDISGNVFSGEYWQIYSTASFSVNSVTIANRQAMFTSSAVSYRVLGSVNGTAWTLLATGSNAPSSAYNTAFPYYRVNYLRVVVGQGRPAGVPNCYAILPVITIDGLLADGNITCGGLVFGDIQCGGTFSGSLSNCAGSFNGSLTSSTQSSITQLGKLVSLDISGNVNLGGLVLRPYFKNGNQLLNCYTFGTERAGSFLPNFVFTSNSQNGYTVTGTNSGNVNGYLTMGLTDASNGGASVQWSTSVAYSDGSQNPFNGLYGGASFLTDSSSVQHKGDWISVTFPSAIVVGGFQIYQLTYYNTPRAVKSYTFLAKLNSTDPWEAILVKTLTSPQPFTTVVETIRNPNSYRYFAFVVRQIQPAYQFVGNVSTSFSKFQIYSVSISENIYIPQSLEIGISENNSLNTTYSLKVSGKSLMDEISVSSLSVTDSFIPRSFCFKFYRDYGGTLWSVTTTQSILRGATVVYDSKPVTLSSVDTTNGWYLAPITGYYSITLSIRAVNGATVGFKPQVYNTVSLTSTFLVGNDNVWWIHDDANLRRMACYTTVVYLVNARDAYFCSPYNGAQQFYWAEMSGYFLGT